MAYNDKLCELIDATPGGRTRENLSRIAAVAREVYPRFTMARLSLLMMGKAAFSPDDIQALATALGVHPREFLEGAKLIRSQNKDFIYRFAQERMNRPDLAHSFYKHLMIDARSRKKVETEVLDFDFLYKVAPGFLSEVSEEESLDS